MSNPAVRTRFAPSPTGTLHVGAARTALYAWLYARQNHGQFILRIEDTDKAREVKGAEANIKESLAWLGLNWDEEYKQSARLKHYQKYAQQLLQQGLAYADPYSKAEVEKFRQDAKSKKQPFLFRNYRPDKFIEWQAGLPLRFKLPEAKSYKWQDDVRGELAAGAEALDDIVILKSDGYPTYNFAHIVDDHLMKVSHVLRGEEFIASMPNYLAIYEALGWQPPNFATMPLILGKDSNKKLSKRDGAQAVLDYRELGYLPEALINFLALLGWNDKTEQEIFSIAEIVKNFSISGIQKSPAKFDLGKLNWISGHHIKQLPVDELLEKAKGFWPPEAKSNELNKRILSVEQERLKNFAELRELPDYFFKTPKPAKQELVVLPVEQLKNWLQTVIEIINKQGSDERAKLEAKIREAIGNQKAKPAELFGALRIALTNADRTPPIWDLVYVLGKQESISRLEQALALL